MLTKEQVRDVSFRKASFGGYKPEDVDVFIDEVYDTYKEKDEQIAKQNKKIVELQKKIEEYKGEESCIRSALTSAQKIADSTVREAKHKAEVILRDANIKAEKVVNIAEDSIIKQKIELECLRKEANKFRSNLLDMYKNHLTIIQAMPSLDNQNQPEKKLEIGGYINNQKREKNKVENNIESKRYNKHAEERKPERNDEKASMEATQRIEINSKASDDSKTNERAEQNKYADLKFGENYDLKKDVEIQEESPIGIFKRV